MDVPAFAICSLFLFRLIVGKCLCAVGEALGGGVVNQIPHRHEDRHEDDGVFHRLQQSVAQRRPGGHILPAHTELGQDRQHDRHRQPHPEHRVFQSDFPVDFHVSLSLLCFIPPSAREAFRSDH